MAGNIATYGTGLASLASDSPDSFVGTGFVHVENEDAGITTGEQFADRLSDSASASCNNNSLISVIKDLVHSPTRSILMAVQKYIPFAPLAIEVVFKENGVGGFVRLPFQGHLRLLRCVVAFLCVALLTGCNKIHPGVHTSPSSWKNVINRKVAAGAAILTFEVVALEYILPCKRNALVRGVHISVQSYHGGHRKTLRNRAELIPVRGFDQLAFLQVYQHKRTLYRTNHERTKVLIQYQHSADHDCNIESIFQGTRQGIAVFTKNGMNEY